MNDHFQPRGRNRVDKIEQLIAVQVVGNGHALGAAGSQVVDRPLVGGIEREVADERNAVLRAKRHAGQVAHEKAAGAVLGHRAEDAHFAGLLNAGRREIDRRAVLARCFDRSPILANVLKIGDQIADAGSRRGLKLVERPTQHSQCRRSVQPISILVRRTASSDVVSDCQNSASRSRRAGNRQLLDHLVPQLAEHA